MSRNTSRHATLVSETKSPLNFLPDFYTNQTCQSCLVRTSPWTSSVHYHLHNETEFGMTLFSYTKTILMNGLKHGPQILNATGEDIADLYFTYIFSQTGLPESIICDRDIKFTSKFWETLM